MLEDIDDKEEEEALVMMLKCLHSLFGIDQGYEMLEAFDEEEEEEKEA